MRCSPEYDAICNLIWVFCYIAIRMRKIQERAIKNWPAEERPREKLLRKGPEGLSHGELLAIILRTGKKKESAVDIARELLIKSGGLGNLINLSMAEICSIDGIGPAKAAQIKAALELGRRVLSEPLSTEIKAVSGRAIYSHYYPYLKNLKKEIFKVILLDGKNKIIRDVTISEGCLNLSIVHPREVFNPAIRDSALSIIALHNHPSGDPTPSLEDIELTKRLATAGNILGIRLLDHIIIGDGRFISLLDKGII